MDDSVERRHGDWVTDLSARQLAIVAAGNALFQYNFLIVTLSSSAETDNVTSAQTGLSPLLAFCGYMMPFLGALAIGTVSDRIGRRSALILCFTLMGIGSLGVALTPPQSAIGIAAPICVTLFRRLQAFAYWGEWASAVALLLELAPRKTRGFRIGFLAASGYFGAICLGLVALSLKPNPYGPHGWVWRLPLLAGVLILAYTLFAQRKLAEASRTADRAAHAAVNYGACVRPALFGLVFVTAYTAAGYEQNFLTAAATAGLPDRLDEMAISSILAASCGFVFAPVGGWLSDRYGRKPIMFRSFLALVAALVVLVVTVLASASQLYAIDLSFVLATAAIAGTLGALFYPAAITALAEAFPSSIRATAVGAICAAANAALLLAWHGPHSLTNGDLIDAALICICGIFAIRAFAAPSSES